MSDQSLGEVLGGKSNMLGVPDYPADPTPQERSYGTDLLKKHILDKAGVHVYTGGPYDDSPTIEESIRRQEAGYPDIGNLQMYQTEMEQNLRKPIIPRVIPPTRAIQLQPIEHNPYTPPVLQPVDHNPFSATLMPVEEDPFGGMGASVTAPPAAAVDALGNFARSVGSGIDELTGAPQRAMAPNPYPPGSEEWQFYEDSRTRGIQNVAPKAAVDLLTAGAGLPERAAAGGMARGLLRAARGEPLPGLPEIPAEVNVGGKTLDELIAELTHDMNVDAARTARHGAEPPPSKYGTFYFPEKQPNTPFFDQNYEKLWEQAGGQRQQQPPSPASPLFPAQMVEKYQQMLLEGKISPQNYDNFAKAISTRGITTKTASEVLEQPMQAARTGLEPDPSASKFSYLPVRPFHDIPNPFPPLPSPADYAALKEQTTVRPKRPQKEEFLHQLKPFEWQEEKPPIAYEDRSLHPLERSTYEKVVEDPERAKRAYMSGFNIDKPLFKGGYGDYPQEIGDPARQKDWERGLFLSDKPEIAQKYGQVAPYVARAEKPHEIDWKSATGGDDYYDSSYMHAIVEAAHHKDVDFLVIRGIKDIGGVQDQYVVLKPSILRAPHAKFDYDKLKHAMPLAGIAGGAIVLDQNGDILHYIRGGRS